MDRNNKTNEALRIYDKIHDYSIKFEESLFRKDYFMNYLRILISINNFVEAIRVVKREIDFLTTCEKCKYEGIAVCILDLMLLYMIANRAHDIEASSSLIELVYKTGCVYGV